MSDLLTLLDDVLSAAGSAMRLHEETLSHVDGGGREAVVAVGVALLAGLSTVLGRWAVLAINGVRGGRLVLAVTVAAMAPVLSYTVLALAVWSAATIVLDVGPSVARILPVVLLSAAPHLFGVLVLLPYIGPLIERMLSVWGALVLWTGVAVVLDVDRWTALGITVAAWLMTEAGQRLLSRPLQWARDRLWRLVTGTPIQLTVQDILESFPMPDVTPVAAPGPRAEREPSIGPTPEGRR